ncbi:MAG: hypothetical protein IKJ48_07840 [Alistipes sp.]|nr:hypothetical protein [Alistipes sp.]
MREIKFRGKRLDNGEWIYGYLHLPIGGDNFMIQVSNIDSFGVIPDTVGQFTGLHDYKGREIYEGDVICSELVSGREVLHKIEYNVENAMFVAKPLEGLDSDYCHIYKHWIWRYGKEVIGNIHDNPKFL